MSCLSGDAAGVADKALLLACSPLLSDAGGQASDESSPAAEASTLKAEGSITDGSQISTVSGKYAHKSASLLVFYRVCASYGLPPSPALTPPSPSCLMDSHRPVHVAAGTRGGVPLSLMIPAILALVSTWLPSYIMKSKRSFIRAGGRGSRGQRERERASVYSHQGFSQAGLVLAFRLTDWAGCLCRWLQYGWAPEADSCKKRLG
jgi:hypothetical protein